jgi:hypothetical protein
VRGEEEAIRQIGNRVNAVDDPRPGDGHHDVGLVFSFTLRTLLAEPQAILSTAELNSLASRSFLNQPSS